MLSGVPTQAGNYTCTVTAGNDVSPAANLTFSINVYNTPTAPAIVDGPPPTNATIGFSYSFAYTASGYPASTFSLKSGQIPPGLTLSSTGILSGMPSQVGTFSGVVTASNGISPAATQSFTIHILQAVAPVITNGPPPATVAIGGSYSFTYKGSGQPTPTFFLTKGSLPPGLALTSGGVLAGVPSQTGIYSGTVTCSNGDNPAATQNFSITVRQVPTITSAPVSVPIALNAPYSFSFTAAGFPIPTFAITAGTLPPGMTLSAAGVLSGAPTQQGKFTATVSAENAAGSAHQAMTISVLANLTLAITLPGTVNEGDADGQGTVTTSVASSNNLTVQLTSSNVAALIVPASVVIPAGQVAVAFPYTIVR